MDELDAQIDALFRRAPAEFTAARNELAKRTGRKRIQAYKKPTLAAWASNQVVLRHAADFSEMRAAHDAATAAAGGDPESLRAALKARRNALAKGLELARAELLDAELACTAATEEKIKATLEALVADRGLDVGRLSKELPRPGFAVLTPPRTGEGLETPRTVLAQRAQTEVRAREEAADAATTQAARAKALARRSADEVSRLEARLHDARLRAKESDEAAARAAREAGDAAVALAEARERLAKLSS